MKLEPRISVLTANIIKKSVVYIVLTIGSVVFFLPFVWQVVTSVKINAQIFTFPPQWLPNPLIWENYPRAWTMVPFATYFMNSAIVSSLCIAGIIVSCSLVAYAFARLEWPGKDTFFVITLAALMVPYQMLMIPLFLIFRRIGWIDTLKPLWVPAWFGGAFHIFLMRQFFLTIPFDLSDAAKIDGCSEFGIYWRITLPLIRPALAVSAIFEFLWTWRDFIGPLIFLNSQENYTVAIGLQQFFGAHGAEWGPLMAAATFSCLPVIILFFFAQKQFIQGITLSGIK